MSREERNPRQTLYWIIGTAVLLTVLCLVLLIPPPATPVAGSPTPTATRQVSLSWSSTATTPTLTAFTPPRATATLQPPPDAPPPVAGHAYYVSPTGDDTNSGEIDSPWNTIRHALSNSPAGASDTIYLRAGVYSEGILYFDEGGPEGADGNYLTVRNYPGERATLRDTSWRFRGRSYIRVQGLYWDQIPVDVLTFQAYSRSVTGIQVLENVFENTTGTPDVTFVRVSNWGRHQQEPSLYLRMTDVLIDNNQMLDDNTSIPDDDGDALQVEGNVDYVRVTNNYFRMPTSIGIGIVGRSWKNDDTLGKDVDDPNPDQPDYVLVKGNTVEGTNGNALYLDGAGSYTIIEDNIVFDSGKGYRTGLRVAGEPDTQDFSSQYTIVRRNTIYNNVINTNLGAKDTTDATPTSCSSYMDIDVLVFVHNTIYTDRNDVDYGTQLYCVENLRYKNNIVVDVSSDGTNFIFDNPWSYASTVTWEMEYNLIYSGAVAKTYSWRGTTYSDLASVVDRETDFVEDATFLEADPRFVDPVAGNFQLKPGSPAIDTGANLTTANGAGTSSATLVVHDSHYFTDGFGLQPGDWIRIGSGEGAERRQIVAIDYNTHTLTLNKWASWPDQALINYDYAGNGPDIGAYERGMVRTRSRG